jgi:hypothetical protein
MSRCPKCARNATDISGFRFGCAYCGNCGWNVPFATKTLREQKLVAWCLAGAGVVFAWVATRGPFGYSGGALIEMAFVVYPAALGVLASYLIVHASGRLALALRTLSLQFQMGVILAAIGLSAVLFSIPLLKWSEWGCPRCGWKFAQPKMYLGKLALPLVLLRLVFDSHCSACGLRCGASYD